MNLLDAVVAPENARMQFYRYRFYATCTFQIDVADHFNVSQFTVSRIVLNVTPSVTRNIAALRPASISITESEKR